MKTTLIACCDSMGGIGKDGGIPWYLPSDLKHFSEYTKGKPCVMGRKTWESLPVKPLPGRKNYVITANGSKEHLQSITSSGADGAFYGGDVDYKSIFELEETELCIIGGASIYEQFLPIATNIVLTNLSKHYHCDTFFPNVDLMKWKCTTVKELEPGVNVNYWERRINE